MTMPKGWLSDGIGKIIGRGVSGTVQGIGEQYGIKPEDYPGLIDMEVGDYNETQVKLRSGFGAIVGQPMGLFPHLMAYYARGLGEIAGKDAARAFETARIPPDIFMKLVYRGYFDEEARRVWQTELLEQGWEDSRITALEEGFRPIAELRDIRDMYFRDELGEGEEAKAEAIRMIQQHGFTTDDAHKLFGLFHFLPSPTDLVVWSAREVFEPEMVEKYGLDSEFEGLDMTLFHKVGVSTDIARNYWRAHWQHASWTQVIEMMHRGYIEEAEVWDWFRLVEIPPFWRDLLIKIAYTPFTRVDVRRMYREGVLSPTEAHQAYMDIGYNKEKADKLMEWTAKYYAPEDTSEDKEVRELTKSEILRAYEDRVIDRVTASTGLVGIDYSEAGAEFLLIMRDVKIVEAYTKEQLKYIQDAYKLGILSDSDMIARLGALDLSGEQQDFYLEKFRRDDTQTVASPSVTDLKRWFKLEIISESEFTAFITKKGYSPEVVHYYVEEVSQAKRSEVLGE